MKSSGKKVKGLVFILIIITALSLCAACSKDLTTIITQYGWHILNDDQSSPTSIVLDNSYLDSEVSQMKIAASKSIGLDPGSYIDKQVDIIQCVLLEQGPTSNLRAEVWSYKNTVICAYLFHAEPNEKLKYWPLDTDLAVIDEYFGS